MTIFRSKKDQNLYILSQLILDIHHLNCNAYSGVYANPYKWQGPQIVFYGKKDDECKKYVDDNFDVVAVAHSIP
jgi:hypothetical protein